MGSRLFGCSLLDSDYDYKGIYLQTLDELLFPPPEKSNRSKEEKKECELFSLKRYMDFILSGKINAIDMFFVPKEYTIISTPEWELIKASKEHLISANITAFIGQHNPKTENSVGDLKARYHIIRSRYEAIELLKTGHITFPRPESDLLYKVRMGKMEEQDIQLLIDELAEEIDRCKAITTLPPQPDKNIVKELTLKIQQEYLKNG